MKNIEIDFYNAFEGDEEITFSISTDEYKKTLRIWHGYFWEIMDKIEPSEEDGWTSLAYYHHLLLGWNREENWYIPNLEEALSQLQSIELLPDYSTNQKYYNAEYRILAEMIDMISEAIDRKLKVYVKTSSRLP
jgi:hypothetical protein